MEYTRETLIKRLGEYVGILPSELHDIACEAVELLERFDCSRGSRLINLDDAIEIISNQQDGSGITYEILSHIIRDILLLPIFEIEQPHCGNLNSEWIPCSERFPEQSNDYICTIPLDEKETFVKVLTFHKGRFYEDDDEWGATFYDDVIAWMPLPTPYKGGED